MENTQKGKSPKIKEHGRYRILCALLPGPSMELLSSLSPDNEGEGGGVFTPEQKALDQCCGFGSGPFPRIRLVVTDPEPHNFLDTIQKNYFKIKL